MGKPNYYKKNRDVLLNNDDYYNDYNEYNYDDYKKFIRL